MDENAKDFDAYNQAAAQMSSIAAMVAALECDYDRLEELREERADLVAQVSVTDPATERALQEWDAVNAEELHSLAADASCGESAEYACKSQEDARERILEDALDINLSGTWQPGATPEADGFTILLCTGGPAVRIKGELDEHNQPDRAWLEYQDWGTPWTEYHGENADMATLLTYCQQFYFGE